MWDRIAAGVLVLSALFAWGHAACGSGLSPDGLHQVTIWGRFPEEEPSFLFVFSAKPLLGARNRPQTTIKMSDLARLKASPDCVPIQVSGKKAATPGQFDYFFGATRDGDQPWNDGRQSRWQDWENASPDVWDCLAIMALPDRKNAAASSGVIENVLIQRNGQLLYDSRAKTSQRSKLSINVAFAPTSLQPKGLAYPILNLAEPMARFRNDYYELQGNPILNEAFADLGQSGFRKYVGPNADASRQWCTEFIAYVYRQCGLPAKDPTGPDMAGGAILEFCRNSGAVYPTREVASWSDEKKRLMIPPGSFAMLTSPEMKGTHSVIFLNWIEEPGKPITSYAAISGNPVVGSHTVSLPAPDDRALAALNPAELAKYDRIAAFGVPQQLHVLAQRIQTHGTSHGRPAPADRPAAKRPSKTTASDRQSP